MSHGSHSPKQVAILEIQQLAEITSVTINTTAKISRKVSDDRAFLQLRPRKNSSVHFSALYDTGAQVSLLTPAAFRLLQQHGYPITPVKGRQPNIVAANRASIKILGTYHCYFTYQGQLANGVFMVSPDISESIIGMNIIRGMGFTIDAVTGHVDYPNRTAAANTMQLKVAALGSGLITDQHFGNIIVTQAYSLPARQATKVRLAVADAQTGNRIRRPVTGLACMDAIDVAFTSDDNGSFEVLIPNASTLPQSLSRGQVLGTLKDINDHHVIARVDMDKVHKRQAEHALRPHTPAEKEALYKQFQESVNATIPYSYRQAYMEMLVANEHFFSASSHDLGRTTLIEHELNVLEPNSTLFKQQFRLSLDSLQMIRENIAGWLQAGIIQPTRSRHNAPVFTVPKKGGQGLRAVLDYRQLNAASLPNHYSIRTIDECIERIGKAGSKIFSALDLTNGYWQVPLREADRPFTAFTIPGVGQFQWNCTPQGLMGAPATFSRLMDLIMGDAVHAVTYLDDVLIHSRSHREHIAHLNNAISRIGRANLRLNPRKMYLRSNQHRLPRPHPYQQRHQTGRGQG